MAIYFQKIPEIWKLENLELKKLEKKFKKIKIGCHFQKKIHHNGEKVTLKNPPQKKKPPFGKA
jgi:hypothetical protein